MTFYSDSQVVFEANSLEELYAAIGETPVEDLEIEGRLGNLFPIMEVLKDSGRLIEGEHDELDDDILELLFD